MNTRSLAILCAAAVIWLPCATLRSQLAPAPVGDALADLQAVQKGNDELLKRQAATVEQLNQLIDAAKQARIMSKRG